MWYPGKSLVLELWNQFRLWFFKKLAAGLKEATAEQIVLPPNISALNTGQRTRLCALIALALSLFSSVVAFWLIFAISSSVEALKRRNSIPKLDANFDAIAAAAAVGRLDIIAMVLTFLGIIAALGVLYGWTAFRAAAVSAALQELENRLPTELRQYMDAKGPAAVGRALEDAELLARLQERFTSLGISDREEATLVDDDPDFKED